MAADLALPAEISALVALSDEVSGVTTLVAGSFKSFAFFGGASFASGFASSGRFKVDGFLE